MHPNSYITIQSPAEGLFKDRGSKFLGFAIPCVTEEQAKKIVAGYREEHPSAVHHCYAYRLGADAKNQRFSDDGEPGGTAGRPIMGTILSANLTNIIIVVVRYYGGTPLGVPGLINAYKNAAAEALAVATVIEKQVEEAYTVTFGYAMQGDVMKILKAKDITLLSLKMEEVCKACISLPKAQAESVLQRLNNLKDIIITPI
ncbi:MAG: YigZ family protein [Sphingobacteriales bacterium JAD_PAG50586_3]|nr:MAG: YigZ family protein [Sphingobacteriales bacterium JAD_PAG50586_3]